MTTEAIVNAANSSLMGGGGVDGAIHRAGGPDILEECKEYVRSNGRLSTGKAIITSAGKLAASFVIHTVGPVWKGGINREDELLANCYINSLHLAREKGLKSISFPNISTGVYGFPKKDAAEVAIETVHNFISSMEDPLKVYFVCFDEENYEIYKKLL